MYVINLWGSPSSGKSTTAAGLFFLMKINKMKVELVTEYAKDLVWSENNAMFKEQSKIFGEQNHRLHRLKGKVDYAITDSPLPIAQFYEPKEDSIYFDKFIMEKFYSYNNLNFFLKRVADYENIGRIQTEEQSKVISDDIEIFLNKEKIVYSGIEATPEAPNKILEYITNLSQLENPETDNFKDLYITK